MPIMSSMKVITVSFATLALILSLLWIMLAFPAFAQKPVTYARLSPAAQSALYDKAYRALVDRLGNGVSMGGRYAVQAAGKLYVCGAGNMGAGRDKFDFLYSQEEDGIALLSDDPVNYTKVERSICHPRG